MGGGSSSGGGHTIENASGVDLPQQDTLQFKGNLKATDDSTNGKTVVDDSPEVYTWEQWNALTPAQQQAIPLAKITGAPDTICDAEDVTFDNTGTSLSFTDVQHAIEEVNTKVDNFKFTKILEVNYQTTTANAWELAATFTITKPALVRALSMFNNSPSKGIALGESDNYVLSLSLVENTTSNIQSLTILLGPGTYNIFTVHLNATYDRVDVYGVYFN